MTLPIALSPCPNDTFLFYAWIHNLVGKDRPCTPTYADIEQLNTWALAHSFPLIKVSIALYASLRPAYTLLPVGCALGWNAGPKIVSKRPYTLSDLCNLHVAFPGAHTTAHRLYNHFAPQPHKKTFTPYHTISTLLQKNSVDAGVLIHETRFNHPFHEIADLGTLWHTRYNLPLPLGGIAVKQEAEHLTSILRASLAYAKAHPHEILPFLQHHAQEKDPTTISSHVALYVNNETEDLSPDGRKAIDLLLSLS